MSESRVRNRQTDRYNPYWTKSPKGSPDLQRLPGTTVQPRAPQFPGVDAGSNIPGGTLGVVTKLKIRATD